MYGDIPDILLDKIAEVHAMLVKYKATSGEDNKSYVFWKGVEDVMKLSWGHHMDVNFIYKDWQLTKSWCEFLTQKVDFLQKKVNKYENVAELVALGQLEDVLKGVNNYIDNPEIQRLRKRRKEIQEKHGK